MAMVEASGTSKLRHRLKIFIVKQISTESARAHPVFGRAKNSARRARDQRNGLCRAGFEPFRAATWWGEAPEWPERFRSGLAPCRRR